jgi:toxin ParE1/3/4
MPCLRLIRTTEAVEDLDAIWDYIAQDSPEAADRVVDELQGIFQLLATYPGMGELQSTLAKRTYRRFTHRNYVIYFRPVEDGILLLRVLHGAREHESLL